MKKRASLLLVLPVFGALLAGCSVPQPVKDGLKTIKNGVKDGTNKAIEIGSIEGKKMYIHFWIYAMGKDDSLARKLEYSIWKER